MDGAVVDMKEDRRYPGFDDDLYSFLFVMGWMDACIILHCVHKIGVRN